MSDLRKAAEMALEVFDGPVLIDATEQAMRLRKACDLLRQALAHEALDRMVAENQRLGLYDEDNLQTTIERGTKAWAGVADATEWVEELRGNDTPEVTPQVTPEVPCKTDPRAPHGFDRNASHSADRYVCECEGWEPVDNAYTKNDTKAGVLHKEWVGLTDEEIYDYADKFLYQHGSNYGIKSFGKALEAKLKEKNGG